MTDQCNEFDGTFNNSSQFTLIPKSLLYLISTLIDGLSPTDTKFRQETLSVAQIVMWNYRKSNKKVNDRQPMMIYIQVLEITKNRY